MAENIYFFAGQHHIKYIHRIAKHLKQEFDANFGITVDHKKAENYVTNQDDIEYSPIINMTDMYNQAKSRSLDEKRLSDLEENYGRPTLWPFLTAEREFDGYTHTQMRKYIQHWFDEYIRILDNFEPNLFLTPSVAAAHSWIPYEITSSKYGDSISLVSTRIGDKYDFKINNPMDELTRSHNLFQKFKENEDDIQNYPDAYKSAKSYLDTFRDSSSSTRPGYFSVDAKRPKIELLRSVPKQFLNAIKYSLAYNIDTFGPNYFKNDFRFDPISTTIYNEIKSLTRRKLNYFNIFSELNKEDFVFFPLHVQPEASTLIRAPLYVDQISLIRKLSKSIPVNYKLYVKDNPNMWGWREYTYYKRLQKIPNVRLIDPMIDSHKLIQESDLVTTITGTAGLEATIYKTPVLTFGNVHYNELDMIYEAEDPKKYSDIILRCLRSHEHNEDELVKYLTAIYAQSFTLPANPYSDPKDNDNEIANVIMSNLRNHLNDTI
jgi:hypothetical protein